MQELPDNQGRITEGIKTRIIRYIHDARLKAGDRLPGYDEMRNIFQCSGTSVTRAMNLLARDGMVEVKSHVGSFVKNPGAGTIFGRTIGILRLGFHGSPFRAFLYHYLQIELNRHGCDSIFFGVDDDENLDEMQRRLTYSLEHGQLQGVLDTTRQRPDVYDSIRRAGIPFVLVGGGSHNLPGACPDTIGYVQAALKTFAQMGKRRPGFVYAGTDPLDRPIADAFVAAATGWSEAGFTPEIFPADGTYAGFELAHTLRKLAPERRPDCLCFADDNTASGCMAAMAQMAASCRIDFISPVLEPQQTIFAVPPVKVFQADLKALARAGVCRLLAEIRHEETPVTIRIPFTETTQPKLRRD